MHFIKDELLKHTNRTVFISHLFANYLGLSKEDKNILLLSAKYHDIGKLFIDDNILYKEGRLTEEEFKIIKMHTWYSHDALLSTEMFDNEILESVLLHHERIDGRGYPIGLKGKDIPETAKVLTICDSYEAMIGERSYREPLTKEEAIKEIEKNLGTQFDEELGKEFIKFLLEEKNI